MHQFQRYDPARPRTVTSFKGNQKLIFEGYRYNIHHIVPSKGAKTWRCVCAKKLTCSRSWCKGRAETWDGDNQGLSKGEHNHAAEHEVAELEYFKSQLILAAISSPNANLNDLIDEAMGFMSEGVSFGSRESLKKSLTVARKAADENGGFKLKCYKSSDKSAKHLEYSKLISSNESDTVMTMTSPNNKVKAPKGEGDVVVTSKAQVMSLLTLAKQCREQHAAVREKDKHQSAVIPRQTATSFSPLSSADSSGFHSSAGLNSSASSASSSRSSASLLFSAYSALPSPVNGKKSGGAHRAQNEAHQQILRRRKAARVNSIFERISNKAAAEAAKMENNGIKEEQRKDEIHFCVAGTQTDNFDEMNNDDMDRDGNDWCVVPICCCANKMKCTKGRKRKCNSADEMEEIGGEHAEVEEAEEQQHSAPPSNSSSVENNQPNGLLEDGKEGETVKMDECGDQ